MKTLKLKIYSLSLMALIALFVGCTTYDNGDSTYVNGWYVVELPYSLDVIHKSAVNSIESGDTYTNNGSNYDIRVNKKTSDKAILEAANDSERGDTLIIELVKISDNLTKVAIKYGKDGNSMRSSAEIGLIKKDLGS
jgi:hypothetical protein